MCLHGWGGVGGGKNVQRIVNATSLRTAEVPLLLDLERVDSMVVANLRKEASQGLSDIASKTIGFHGFSWMSKRSSPTRVLVVLLCNSRDKTR